MSTHTQHSDWSPEEIDSLENIDKEIQLVSTSSDSYSTSNHPLNKGTESNSKVISDSSAKVKLTEQPKNKNFTSGNSKESTLKLHSSCDDLPSWTGNKSEFNPNSSQDDPIYNHSTTSGNLKSNKKTNSNKYDHVESKIKHYFNNNNKPEVAPQKPKNTVISEIKKNNEKEEYLQEINKQLTKELDEKNAILSLLQENYEHLLFKYAEAQNRIDELRFKFISEANESKNISFGKKYNRTDNQIPSYFHCEDEYLKSDLNYQKAVVAPYCKGEEAFHNTTNEVVEPPASRPSTLPLEKYIDRDLIKATTPTDSEGLSSIITSMSGHSKIINSLDEENQINKKSNFLKYQKSNFVLEETPPLNDPFDKVKNWQNSLPPLEQIETPETTLYNVFANNSEVYSPAETKYKDITSPKTDKEYNFLNESCPSSWQEDRDVEYYRNSDRFSPEDHCKMSNRASSLPNTLKKPSTTSEAYNKTHNSLDVGPPENGHFTGTCFPFKEKSKDSQNDIGSAFVQRNKKRPQLLRCSSLPTYDYNCLNSSNYKNGIYIPPLNLNNITLSDDESSSQNNSYVNKTIAITSSSFVSSRASVDRSIQTLQSFSSCKATISEENSYSRVPRSTVSKSTSITPDRTKAMDLCFPSKYDRIKETSWRRNPSTCIKECNECCSDNIKARCNVCGETICENKSVNLFQNRSNSCESINKSKISSEEGLSRRPKPPFTRSVSFNSEPNTPKYCSRDEEVSENFFSGLSQDSLDNFDVYTRNLKARSQVVIKALTAHVNNS